MIGRNSLEAITQVWEDFGEAMEHDFGSGFKEILANHQMTQKGKAGFCLYCIQWRWTVADLN